MADLESAEALLGDDDVGDYELGQDEEAELLRDDDDENEVVLSFQAEPLEEEDDEETERDKFASERQKNAEPSSKPREQSDSYRSRKRITHNPRGGRGQYSGGRGGKWPQFNQSNAGPANRIGTGLCYIKPALLTGEWEKKPVQSVQPQLNNVNPEYDSMHTRFPPSQQQQQMPSGHYNQTSFVREVSMQYGPNQNTGWQPLTLQQKQPQGQYGFYNNPNQFNTPMHQNQNQQFYPPNSSTFGNSQPPSNNYYNQQPQNFPQNEQMCQQVQPTDNYQHHPQMLPPQQFQSTNFQGGFNNHYQHQSNSSFQPYPTSQNEQVYDSAPVRQVFQARNSGGGQQYMQSNQNRFVSSPPEVPLHSQQPIHHSQPYPANPPQQYDNNMQAAMPRHSFNNPSSPRLPPRNNFKSQFPPRGHFNSNYSGGRFPYRGRAGGGRNYGYHQQFHGHSQQQQQGSQSQEYHDDYYQNDYKRRADEWNYPENGPKKRSAQEEYNYGYQGRREVYEEYQRYEEYPQDNHRDNHRDGRGSDHQREYGMERRPEIDEDEETKAYRLQIEEQKRQREEILAQKEKNRKLAVMQKSAPEVIQRKPGQPLLKTPSIPPIHVVTRKMPGQGYRLSGNSSMTCATNPNLRVIQRQELGASNNIQINSVPMTSATEPVSDKFLSERKVLAKDDALLNTSVVVVRNLAASSSEPQLRKLCNSVGLIQVRNDENNTSAETGIISDKQ